MNSHERNVVKDAAVRYQIATSARARLAMVTAYSKHRPPRAVEDALEIVALWLRSESAADLDIIFSALGMYPGGEPAKVAEDLFARWTSDAQPKTPLCEAVEKIAGDAG